MSFSRMRDCTMSCTKKGLVKVVQVEDEDLVEDEDQEEEVSCC